MTKIQENRQKDPKLISRTCTCPQVGAVLTQSPEPYIKKAKDWPLLSLAPQVPYRRKQVQPEHVSLLYINRSAEAIYVVLVTLLSITYMHQKNKIELVLNGVGRPAIEAILGHSNDGNNPLYCI